jgi:hypothetical protein
MIREGTALKAANARPCTAKKFSIVCATVEEACPQFFTVRKRLLCTVADYVK